MELSLTAQPFDQSRLENSPILLTRLPAMQELRRRRRRYIVTASLFLLIFNMAQPVLSVSTRWLDAVAFGNLTWGWIYAFAQFPVPLAVLHLYLRKAREYEKAAHAIREVNNG